MASTMAIMAAANPSQAAAAANLAGQAAGPPKSPKEVAVSIAFFLGSAALGVFTAWITMRILNRRKIASLKSGKSKYTLVDPKAIAGDSLSKGLREWYNGKTTVDGKVVRTALVTPTSSEWVAYDEVFTKTKPLYDSRCEPGHEYGCNSYNAADTSTFECEEWKDYCLETWDRNQRWWAAYNAENSGIPGKVCTDATGQKIDCYFKTPYDEQAQACFYGEEMKNTEKCAEFRKNWCLGYQETMNCLYPDSLPDPSTIDWEGAAQGSTASCVVDNLGFYYGNDNKGTNRILLMRSPYVSYVHPNLPQCQANDIHCREGREHVPIYAAVCYNGRTWGSGVKSYGYYGGSWEPNAGLITSPLAKGQFTVNFPTKEGCVRNQCPGPAPEQRSALRENNKFETTSTLRCGGQA